MSSDPEKCGMALNDGMITPNTTVSLQPEEALLEKTHNGLRRSSCECVRNTQPQQNRFNRRCLKFRYPTYISVFLVLILFTVDTTIGLKERFSRKKRYSPAVFPSNSEIEVAWEVGIPIGLEGKDVEVGLFLEADYSLPDNVTYLYPDNILNTYTGRRRRRRIRPRRNTNKKKRGPITRAAVYVAIEATLESLGLDGQSCLLRSICEASETPLYHGSLVAELLHVLFTPSTTSENDLSYDYIAAEELGKKNSDCFSIYPECPSGIFDIITTVYEE
ncbi:uncharacterized protein LOC124167175 [Ischnura elegans]|uniref:uncharacterized protein LOC124167175 n=1 Tax=Ischnura elegans TaxID=197161 RepID=UPI001ED872D1|nr:uncharacterized protein LOC124167175 [Ischnura elegans]